MSPLRTRSPARFVAFLMLGASACASAAGIFPKATPESQQLSSQALAQLADTVRGFVDKGDIVGGELLVIKNRRTVLHEAFGYADLERKKPLERDTIYCIRSMTKPLAGAAVQILIDEGRLSLDDTAAKYLPSFDNDKSRGITVRQLLTHTGGLPLSSLLGTDFRTLHSLRDVADISGKNGPTIPPGSGFQYSDDGADTLGAIIAAITGHPAEEFIRQRVLEPLGMRDTFPLVSTAGSRLDRFTPAFAGSRGNWMRIWSPKDEPLFRYFLASQGMYSTTRDYARFLALYLDHGRAGRTRVLTEAAVKRTLEPVSVTRFPTGFGGLTTWYGQLMIDYVDADKKLVAFGHNGSDGTWAYAWPGQDLMVLFFTQSRGNEVGRDLEAAIDRLLPGRSAAPKSPDLTATAAAPYLGLYWFEPAQKPMIVVFERDRLALDIPWGGLVELEKTDEQNAWSLTGSPEVSVKFHRDGNGPATAFDLRRRNPVTLMRLEPDASLPGLDEILARRPDKQRAQTLSALGLIRLTGTLEASVGQKNGSFEILASGDDHFRLTLNVDGSERRVVVAGDRGWAKPQASMPAQPMPEAMTRAARAGSWMSSTGDWRREFAQTRVLKRVEVDGQSQFLVHAAPARGHNRLIYMAENGLVMGYDEVQELPGLGMAGCEVRFSDYRDVDGVQIPFKSTVKYPSPVLGTQTYVVQKAETHVQPEGDPFILE
jgi:CubicO group peptidase (beta-lactamase class C family)